MTAPTNETCLACGHDDPHDHPIEYAEVVRLECGLCGCTDDRRTIAALRAEVERLRVDAALGANVRELAERKGRFSVTRWTRHITLYLGVTAIDADSLVDADTLDAAVHAAVEAVRKART